jgi:hypothetical protein
MVGQLVSIPVANRKVDTAVPFETTATRLDRLVYRAAAFGSAWMAMHEAATPGEYAKARSR